MTPTSYWTFIDNLHGLDVDDVRTNIKYPPTDINAEELPLKFVHLPASPDEWPMTFDDGGGWPTLEAQLVIVVEPVAADIQERNYDDGIRMMDNVAAALRGAACGLAKAAPRWGIRLDTISVAEVTYWAVLADVVAHG